MQAEKHFYSVPYQLVSKDVEVRLTSKSVEIFYKGKRVAGHLRSYIPGGYTTDPAHRPKSHQKYLSWTPSRLIRWAQTVGPACGKAAESILKSKPYPEQSYRACLGMMRLEKSYGHEAMEAACKRALVLDVCSYRSLESILKTGLYKQPPEEQTSFAAGGFDHKNVRGKTYYQ